MFLCDGIAAHALDVSPFYRVYSTYEHILPRMSKGFQSNKTDVHLWFEFLVNYLDQRGLLLPNDRHVIDDLIITPTEAELISDLGSMEEGSYILSSDLRVVKTFLSRPMRQYGAAEINGHMFHGRGTDFTENLGLVNQKNYGAQEDKFVTRNVLNTLGRDIRRTSPTELKNYTGWCKYLGSGLTTKCAQLNFFFRLFIPEDIVLHGLPMASIVTRNHIEEEYVIRINCLIDDQAFQYMDDFDTFVAVTSIYPTAQLVAPFDQSGSPMLMMRVHPEQFPRIHHLYLIDLYPENSRYMYESESHAVYNNSELDVN